MLYKIKKGNGECIICEDVIINPICHFCLKNHLLSWIFEKLPHLANLVERELRNLRKTTIKAQNNCGICGRPVKLCVKCYTQTITDALEKDYPELVDEFQRTFLL